MKLYNPTPNTISVRIFGVDYTVLPKSETVDLEKDVADYWLTLHAFLEKSAPKITKEKDVITKEEPKKVIKKK